MNHLASKRRQRDKNSAPQRSNKLTSSVGAASMTFTKWQGNCDSITWTWHDNPAKHLIETSKTIVATHCAPAGSRENLAGPACVALSQKKILYIQT